jgi:hypothetical protein
VDLTELSLRQLRARRRRLARSLADPETTLQGTLLHQHRRCGKPGCRCADGELHGPYTYLSVGRSAGAARLLYVPAAIADEVGRRVRLTEAAEAGLAEISAVNLELLARRELEP